MKSKLFKNDKIFFEFDFPIQEVRELEDRVIVVLRIPQEKVYNENVFCITNEGKLLWQIEKKEMMRERSPYMGTTYKNNELIAHNLISFDMYLDINTGKILKTEFSK